jgi:ketosteroid isomerase-like protein
MVGIGHPQRLQRNRYLSWQKPALKVRLRGAAMKVLFTVLLLLLSPRLSSPQTSARPDDDQSKILALENAWNLAEEHKDVKALEMLLHPNLVYIDYDGSRMTKDEFIASVKAPELHPQQIVNESVTAYVYGDSAVATGVYKEKGVRNGKAYQRRGRFTDAWVFQSGRWMCVASQSTLIGK